MLELMQLQNIKVEIQDQAIFENINMNVQQGDIIGIIGKNGAGKSTLSNDGLLQAVHFNMPIKYLEVYGMTQKPFKRVKKSWSHLIEDIVFLN